MPGSFTLVTEPVIKQEALNACFSTSDRENSGPKPRDETKLCPYCDNMFKRLDIVKHLLTFLDAHRNAYADDKLAILRCVEDIVHSITEDASLSTVCDCNN